MINFIIIIRVYSTTDCPFVFFFLTIAKCLVSFFLFAVMQKTKIFEFLTVFNKELGKKTTKFLSPGVFYTFWKDQTVVWAMQ